MLTTGLQLLMGEMESVSLTGQTAPSVPSVLAGSHVCNYHSVLVKHLEQLEVDNPVLLL